MIRRSTAAAVLLVWSSLAAHAQTPSTQVPEQQTKMLNLSAYAELLRSDVQAQKIAILTEVMGFTESEDKAFWPIYRDYNLEMAKLGDERVALIQEYAKSYSQMTDAIAQSVAARAIDLQKRRNDTLEKCYARVGQALPAKQALKFLQIEHQLLLIIDLQISALLPIVK